MLWDALAVRQSGLIAIVGAGGKTSVIQSLARAAIRRNSPVMVTTTTKMYLHQAKDYKVIIRSSYDLGLSEVKEALLKGEIPAWYSQSRENKVLGLPPEWLDKLAEDIPEVHILIEADGAQRKLLKAPGKHEPVIPESTSITVGVLNLSVIGEPLAEVNTHRLEQVTGILGKQPGEAVEWLDLAKLSIHENGIFQYSRGRRVLLLAGGMRKFRSDVNKLGAFIKKGDTQIDRIIVTIGYGRAMQLSEVFEL